MSAPTATPDPRELEALAVSLAQGAGTLVRDGRRAAAGRSGGLGVDAKSTATDLVTDLDRRSERWLVEQLAALRPGDAVLGEEGAGHDGGPGGSGGPGGRVRWVVDPIDGTVNFVLGLPGYAVSVAAEVDGRVVAGAVCAPETGETFHARLGGGAHLTTAGSEAAPRRLTGPRDVPLARAVVATGFAYDAAVRARQGAVVARLLPRIADIRRLGAAALDLCALAAGRVDGYFEAGLHRWDYAAGALVATEAGCAVAGLGGRPPGEHFLLAAGPSLVDDLAAALADLAADTVR